MNKSNGCRNFQVVPYEINALGVKAFMGKLMMVAVSKQGGTKA